MLERLLERQIEKQSRLEAAPVNSFTLSLQVTFVLSLLCFVGGLLLGNFLARRASRSNREEEPPRSIEVLPTASSSPGARAPLGKLGGKGVILQPH